MSDKKFIKLPESELEVMQAIWALNAEGEKFVSAGLIMKRFPALCRLKLTTVLTLITRLQLKGFISSEKLSRANCYKPLIDADEYRRFVAGDFVERVGHSRIYLAVGIVVIVHPYGTAIRAVGVFGGGVYSHFHAVQLVLQCCLSHSSFLCLIVDVDGREREARLDGLNDEVLLDGERCAHVVLLADFQNVCKVLGCDVVVACGLAVCHVELISDGVLLG